MVVERGRSMIEDWQLANGPCANGQVAVFGSPQFTSVAAST
jgi:hypothetical protein